MKTRTCMILILIAAVYGLLVDQIKTILTWHDRAMVHADDDDNWYNHEL